MQPRNGRIQMLQFPELSKRNSFYVDREAFDITGKKYRFSAFVINGILHRRALSAQQTPKPICTSASHSDHFRRGELLASSDSESFSGQMSPHIHNRLHLSTGGQIPDLCRWILLICRQTWRWESSEDLPRWILEGQPMHANSPKQHFNFLLWGCYIFMDWKVIYFERKCQDGERLWQHLICIQNRHCFFVCCSLQHWKKMTFLKMNYSKNMFLYQLYILYVTKLNMNSSGVFSLASGSPY